MRKIKIFHRKELYIVFCLFLMFLVVNINSKVVGEKEILQTSQTSLLVELPYTITIDNNWAEIVEKYEWCSGSGTEKDPYVIEGISINSGDRGACIYIIDSAEYFIIRNCNFSNVIRMVGNEKKFAGIYIEKAEFGIIENNTFYKNYLGISIFEAENVIIRNNEFYGTHNDTNTGYGRAVLIYEAKEVSVYNNYMLNYYEGVVAFFSEGCYVDYNHIENYLFKYTANAGVYFRDVNSGSITYNDFYGVDTTTQNSTGLSTASAGFNPITLDNCFNIEVYGNRFFDSDGNLIGEIGDSEIFLIVLLFSVGIGSVIIIIGVIIIKKRKKS